MLQSERDRPVWDIQKPRSPAAVCGKRVNGGYLRKSDKRRNHSHPTHRGTIWVDGVGELLVSGWEDHDSAGKWYISLAVTARSK